MPASEVHRELTSGDFSTWIKDRVTDNPFFVEGVDCITEKIFPRNGGKVGRGRPTIEYHVTLDVADHLSMMERNAYGHAFRQRIIARKRAVRQMTGNNNLPALDEEN